MSQIERSQMKSNVQLIADSLTLEYILDLANLIAIHNMSFKSACSACQIRQCLFIKASPHYQRAFIVCRCKTEPYDLAQITKLASTTPITKYRPLTPVFIKLNRQGNVVALAYYCCTNGMKGGVRFSKISDMTACSQFAVMLYYQLPASNFVVLSDYEVVLREFSTFMCVQSTNCGQEYNDCIDKVSIISEDAIFGSRPENYWQ